MDTDRIYASTKSNINPFFDIFGKLCEDRGYRMELKVCKF
jgi:hypothetical protein